MASATFFIFLFIIVLLITLGIILYAIEIAKNPAKTSPVTKNIRTLGQTCSDQLLCLTSLTCSNGICLSPENGECSTNADCITGDCFISGDTTGGICTTIDATGCLNGQPFPPRTSNCDCSNRDSLLTPVLNPQGVLICKGLPNHVCRIDSDCQSNFCLFDRDGNGACHDFLKLGQNCTPGYLCGSDSGVQLFCNNDSPIKTCQRQGYSVGDLGSFCTTETNFIPPSQVISDLAPTYVSCLDQFRCDVSSQTQPFTCITTGTLPQNSPCVKDADCDSQFVCVPGNTGGTCGFFSTTDCSRNKCPVGTFCRPENFTCGGA